MRVRTRKLLFDQRTAWQQRRQAQLFHQGIALGLEAAHPRRTSGARASGALPGRSASRRLGRRVFTELHQLARMLRQITGELAAIHRHLAGVLADVTRVCADTLQRRRRCAGSASDDAQRLLRRLELAVDVMSAELERVEQRQRDD